MKKHSLFLVFFSIIFFSSAKLPPPIFQIVEASPTSIALSWQAVSEADGYEVVVIAKKYKYYYVGTPYILLNESIVPGRVYSIYLRAYEFSHNNHSDQSSYCLLTPPLAHSVHIHTHKKQVVAKWERAYRSYDYYFYLASDSLFLHPIDGYDGLQIKKHKLKLIIFIFLLIIAF